MFNIIPMNWEIQSPSSGTQTLVSTSQDAMQVYDGVFQPRCLEADSLRDDTRDGVDAGVSAQVEASQVDLLRSECRHKWIGERKKTTKKKKTSKRRCITSSRLKTSEPLSTLASIRKWISAAVEDHEINLQVWLKMRKVGGGGGVETQRSYSLIE